MTPDRLINRKLVGVFLLGWILYNYPILSLFNLPALFLGIPLLFGYMFFVWALVIGLVMLVTRIRRPRNGSDV